VPAAGSNLVVPVRTYTPKPDEVERAWHVIDADGAVLGRLATEVAKLLRGKHKPIWAPHIDTGDHVIVVNASALSITPRKLDDKRYYRHSGYPGGLRETSVKEMFASHPERAAESSGSAGSRWSKAIKTIRASPTRATSTCRFLPISVGSISTWMTRARGAKPSRRPVTRSSKRAPTQTRRSLCCIAVTAA